MKSWEILTWTIQGKTFYKIFKLDVNGIRQGILYETSDRNAFLSYIVLNFIMD
jgi:hypothetical protein